MPHVTYWLTREFILGIMIISLFFHGNLGNEESQDMINNNANDGTGSIDDNNVGSSTLYDYPFEKRAQSVTYLADHDDDGVCRRNELKYLHSLSLAAFDDFYKILMSYTNKDIEIEVSIKSTQFSGSSYNFFYINIFDNNNDVSTRSMIRFGSYNFNLYQDRDNNGYYETHLIRNARTEYKVDRYLHFTKITFRFSRWYIRWIDRTCSYLYSSVLRDRFPESGCVSFEVIPCPQPSSRPSSAEPTQEPSRAPTVRTIPTKEEVAYLYQVENLNTKIVAELFCIRRLATFFSRLNDDASSPSIVSNEDDERAIAHCRSTRYVPSYLPGAEFYALLPAITALLDDAAAPQRRDNRRRRLNPAVALGVVGTIASGIGNTIGVAVDVLELVDRYKAWRDPEQAGATKKDVKDMGTSLAAEVARQTSYLREEVFNDQVWALTETKSHNMEMRDDIKEALEHTIDAQTDVLRKEIGCGNGRGCDEAWNRQEQGMKRIIEEGRERMQLAQETNEVAKEMLGMVSDLQGDVTAIYSNTLNTLSNQQMIVNNQKLIQDELAKVGVGVDYLVNVERERQRQAYINAEKRQIGNVIVGITGLIDPELAPLVKYAYDHGEKFIKDLGGLINSNVSNLGQILSIANFGLGLLGALTSIGRKSDLEIMMTLIQKVMKAIDALGRRLDAKLDIVIDKLMNIENLQDIALENLDVALSYLTDIVSDIGEVQRLIHYHAMKDDRDEFLVYELSYRFLPYGVPPFEGPETFGIPGVNAMLSKTRKYLLVDAVDAFNRYPTGSSIDSKIEYLKGASNWGIYQTPLSLFYFENSLVREAATKPIPNINKMAGQHWIFGMQWLIRLIENFPHKFRLFPGSSTFDEVLTPARYYQTGLESLADPEVAATLRDNYIEKLNKYMTFLVNERDEFFSKSLTTYLNQGQPSAIEVVFKAGYGYMVRNIDDVYCLLIDKTYFQENGHCHKYENLNIWDKTVPLMSMDAALIAAIGLVPTRAPHSKFLIRKRIGKMFGYPVFCVSWRIIEIDGVVQFYVVSSTYDGDNPTSSYCGRYSPCYGLFEVDGNVICYEDFKNSHLQTVRVLGLRNKIKFRHLEWSTDFLTFVPDELRLQMPVKGYKPRGENLGKLMRWKAFNLSEKLQSSEGKSFIKNLGSGPGGSIEAKQLKHAMLLLQRYHNAVLPSISHSDSYRAMAVRKYASPGQLFDPDVMVSFFEAARNRATEYARTPDATIADLAKDEAYVQSVLTLDFLYDIKQYVRSSKENVVKWYAAVTEYINELHDNKVNETPWVDSWALRYKVAKFCSRSGADYCGPVERLPIPTGNVAPAVGRMIHDRVPIYKDMDVTFNLALYKYSHPKEANIFLVGEERESQIGQSVQIILDSIVAAYALPDRTLRLDISTSNNGVAQCQIKKYMEEARVYTFLFKIRKESLSGFFDGQELCSTSLLSPLATLISHRPLFLSSPDHPPAQVDISGLRFSKSIPTEIPSNSPSSNPTKVLTKNPSRSPTKIPTKKPSESPTKSPTKSPSDRPTKIPSNKPSKVITKWPSQSKNAPKKIETRRPRKTSRPKKENGAGYNSIVATVRGKRKRCQPEDKVSLSTCRYAGLLLGGKLKKGNVHVGISRLAPAGCYMFRGNIRYNLRDDGVNDGKCNPICYKNCQSSPVILKIKSKNVSCDDQRDHIPMKDCINAGLRLGGKLRRKKMIIMNRKTAPTGCFLFRGSIGFNKHNTGVNDGKYNPICKNTCA